MVSNQFYSEVFTFQSTFKSYRKLLDIVFAPLPYAKTIEKEIENDLIITTGDNLKVEIPTLDCILGDKLTAFAPHTTGILLGSGKDLEIAKQMFDVATLFDYLNDYDLFAETYANSTKEETAFRGENWSQADILQDTVRACISIISKGKTDSADYAEYLRGIKSLRNHVLAKDYNTDYATWKACKVLYLTSCLLSGNPPTKINNSKEYLTARLHGEKYKGLSYVRKQNSEAYAYLVEATRNL